MLRSTKTLEDFSINAVDGRVGHVKDFYFDDENWIIRYLIVDTGSWLSSRKVLISPISIHDPNWHDRTLPISVTKDKVKNSPAIDTALPVSRQNEEDYMGYYGYPNYWAGGGMWGLGLYPYAMVPGYVGYGGDREEKKREMEAYRRVDRARHEEGDPHLRSCKAVSGYRLRATDGELGHLAGYLIDDRVWAIRYVVIDTSNWWGGHQVLIATDWISGMDWAAETLSVNLTRAAVKDAPAYDPDIEWTRQLELSLYQHYGRTSYWAGDAGPGFPKAL